MRVPSFGQRYELIGDVTPGLMRRLGIGLEEGLADPDSDHYVLTLGFMGERIAHPMRAAPLPGRAMHTVKWPRPEDRIPAERGRCCPNEQTSAIVHRRAKAAGPLPARTCHWAA
jgi:hypothetical protein